MADLNKVKDDELRGRLQDAHAHLRAGRPTDAVHTLADAFLWMLDAKPELRTATVSGIFGARQVVAMWPALGANFLPESIAEGKPRLVFVRDRFAMSEAITYFEFTVDVAINQGM